METREFKNNAPLQVKDNEIISCDWSLTRHKMGILSSRTRHQRTPAIQDRDLTIGMKNLPPSSHVLVAHETSNNFSRSFVTQVSPSTRIIKQNRPQFYIKDFFNPPSNMFLFWLFMYLFTSSDHPALDFCRFSTLSPMIFSFSVLSLICLVR